MTIAFVLEPTHPKSIVFIHGLLGSSEDFFPLASLLSRYFCCIGIDLPGHGKAQKIRCGSLKAVAEKIKELLSPYDCTYGVGYSLGGRVLLMLDFIEPLFFKKISILSSHIGLPLAERKKKKGEENLWARRCLEDFESFLEAWYSQGIFDRSNTKAFCDKRKNNSPQAIAQSLKDLGLSRQKNLQTHVSNQRDKFMFLYGENDEKYKKLYQGLPIISFCIDGCSHAIHIENPELCAKHIACFLFA